LELHCARDEAGLLELTAAGGFTFFAGYVGGHGFSRVEFEAFLLALYTASRKWKQQVINFLSLDPRREWWALVENLG
jgi:hypothetical protein